MLSTGRYLYGLIRATENVEFGYIGLEHQGKPGRVFTIRADQVAAVVSEFSRAEKLLPLRKNLDPHHRVIREVMKTSTIIPMTFGHVAESEEEVAETLCRNCDDILLELERLDGMIEMSVRVRWDVDNIFEYFVRENPDLAAFRDRIFGRSSAPAHAEKIELGRMFGELMDWEREKHTEQVVEMFRSCVADIRVNPHKNEKVVMDLAFLIHREKVKTFEEKVYNAAVMFPAQYTFDFNGPWAPFNFVELDLETAVA